MMVVGNEEMGGREGKALIRSPYLLGGGGLGCRGTEGMGLGTQASLLDEGGWEFGKRGREGGLSP